VVSQIKVGERGHAYVVDAQGRLITHPDISLVLRNTDMSKLAQVRATRAATSGGVGTSDNPSETVQEAENIEGRKASLSASTSTFIVTTMPTVAALKHATSVIPIVFGGRARARRTA